jgi:hypothetical protein
MTANITKKMRLTKRNSINYLTVFNFFEFFNNIFDLIN